MICRQVNAKPMQLAPVEMLSPEIYPGLANPGSYETRSTAGDRRASERYHYRSRAPLPVLETRSAQRYDLLDSPVSNSPLDGYTYAPSTIARQDSFASTHSTDATRTWSTSYSSAPVPAPAYYDLHAGYSFGTMQAPETHHYSRLPSVSAESLSSLNMGHLHSSLPGAHDRRLPVPYISQHPQASYAQTEIPVARPLGSFSTPRSPNQGMQARYVLPWPLGTGTSAPRSGSMSVYAPPNSMYTTCSQTVPSVSQSALSYHFHPTVSAPAVYNSSPEISPTSGPNVSTSFDSSSSSDDSGVTMHPYAGNMRYYPSTSSQQDMTTLTSTNTPTSSRQRSMQEAPSFYSYGTTSSDAQSTSSEQEDSVVPSSGVATYTFAAHDTRASIDADICQYNDPAHGGGYQNHIQHPRPRPFPHHSVSMDSMDSLCRQSSFERQPAHTSTASRMSISNFSGSYQ